MTIRVLYFAGLRDSVGIAEESIELPARSPITFARGTQSMQPGAPTCGSRETRRSLATTSPWRMATSSR
jgi:hypothetical protein